MDFRPKLVEAKGFEPFGGTNNIMISGSPNLSLEYKIQSGKVKELEAKNGTSCHISGVQKTSAKPVQ